jgi:hypothetical protein
MAESRRPQILWFCWSHVLFPGLWMGSVFNRIQQKWCWASFWAQALWGCWLLCLVSCWACSGGLLRAARLHSTGSISCLHEWATVGSGPVFHGCHPSHIWLHCLEAKWEQATWAHLTISKEKSNNTLLFYDMFKTLGFGVVNVLSSTQLVDSHW